MAVRIAMVAGETSSDLLASHLIRAIRQHLPDAELHLLDGGHWLLETCLDEVAALMRDFLGRAHGAEDR